MAAGIAGQAKVAVALPRHVSHTYKRVLCGFWTCVVTSLHLRWASMVRNVCMHGPRDVAL